MCAERPLTLIIMTRKVKWGVISTAKIGVKQVIPAMQQCAFAEVVGIASRSEDAAAEAARDLGIPRHYSSYEALLADPEIDAIYNPLPNHMHLEWTEKAIRAGKHVLCEKPLVLRTNEVRQLMKLRDEYKVKVGEAFMVHTHPQWVDAVDRIKNGELGKLKIAQGFFSYFNLDAQNIRNIKEYGGGSLWDIGCYTIHTSRYAFGENPKRVMATIDYDKEFGTDVLVTAMMEFPSGQASFHVSTQLVSHQRMSFYGDKKRLDIEIPFNAPNDKPCRAFINESTFSGVKEIKIEHPVCDQYQVQGDAFSKAILENTEVPVPLEDSLGNVATIEAMFRSAETGKWEVPTI